MSARRVAAAFARRNGHAVSSLTSDMVRPTV
jgi:hypothetical protein